MGSASLLAGREGAFGGDVAQTCPSSLSPSPPPFLFCPLHAESTRLYRTLDGARALIRLPVPTHPPAHPPTHAPGPAPPHRTHTTPVLSAAAGTPVSSANPSQVSVAPGVSGSGWLNTHTSDNVSYSDSDSAWLLVCGLGGPALRVCFVRRGVACNQQIACYSEHLGGWL